MNTLFDKVKQQASELFPEHFSPDEKHGFFLLDLAPFLLAFLPVDDQELYVRTRICKLGKLVENTKLLEELLEGNRFYQGTAGATLSLGTQNNSDILFLSERVPTTALIGNDNMTSFCELFMDTAASWLARCKGYLPDNESLEEWDSTDSNTTSSNGLDMDFLGGIRI